jgi:uncharacterized protein YheU (UPF0270 family)
LKTGGPKIYLFDPMVWVIESIIIKEATVIGIHERWNSERVKFRWEDLRFGAAVQIWERTLHQLELSLFQIGCRLVVRELTITDVEFCRRHLPCL